MTARPVKEEEVEEEMGDGIGEERVASPPPPRCPTTWVVQSSTPEEKECFREQVYYLHCVCGTFLRSVFKIPFLLNDTYNVFILSRLVLLIPTTTACFSLLHIRGCIQKFPD
jgi:hypothetical protein